MSDSRRRCSLNWEAVQPGAKPSKHQFLEVFAAFDHLGEDTPSSLGLCQPAHLQSYSATTTASKIDAHIPATGRQLDSNALHLEFVLDDLGSLGVAADQRGLGRDGKAPLPQKSGKVNGSFGGVVLQERGQCPLHALEGNRLPKS